MVLIIVATYSGGFLLPCSQSFNVATGMPNKSANFVWLNPVCARISLIFINTTSFRLIIRRCLRLYKWIYRKRKPYVTIRNTAANSNVSMTPWCVLFIWLSAFFTIQLKVRNGFVTVQLLLKRGARFFFIHYVISEENCK